MTPTPSRVAVIGGGWAGMAAASMLAEAGVPVDVYEAAKVLGGRARRVNLDGIELDNGLHLLLGAYTGTLAAIERVGATSRAFVRTPLHLERVDGFRLSCPALPAPWHLIAGLLGARGIGWGDRMAVARFMDDVRRADHDRVPPISVTDYLDRHRQPPRLRDTLWHPLCVAALNTPPEIADARVFLSVLRDGLAGERTASDLVFPATDLSAMFPEPAASYVAARGGTVRTSEPVTAIAVDGNGFSVRTPLRSEPYGQVVCAVDPARAPALMDGLPALSAVAASVNALRHAPIVSVYLDYGEEVSLAAPMLGLVDGPGEWLFDRGQLCGQRGWLGAVISASDHWAGTPRDTLAAQVEAQVARWVTVPGPTRRSQVITEKRATFLCTPGLARPAQQTPLRGFHLAGDYTASVYPATLESAVRSGFACARAVLENR